MLALKLGFRSFVRRGWGLLFVVAPAALLFAMLTFSLATEISVHELAKPAVIDRSIRLGSVSGYPPNGAAKYTPAEVNKYATIPGVSLAPATFMDCNVDPNNLGEFTCGSANRTYLQIHEYAISITEAELDRWDAVKNGAIVLRPIAEKYHWKVGDRIKLHCHDRPDLDLVITSIQDKFLEQNSIYFHNEYREQVTGTVNYWVVWMLVDKAERRQAVMDQLDADLSSIRRPHTIWKGEDTLKMLLTTSATLVNAFEMSGAVAFVLVLCLSVTLLIVSIEQRRTEIATMMAIGFRRPVLAGSILVEGVLFLFVSSLVGAFGTSLLFHDHPLLLDVIVSVRTPLLLAVIVTGGGTLLGLLSATVPAWRSLRLDVLSALRS